MSGTQTDSRRVSEAEELFSRQMPSSGRCVDSSSVVYCGVCGWTRGVELQRAVGKPGDRLVVQCGGGLSRFR